MMTVRGCAAPLLAALLLPQLALAVCDKTVPAAPALSRTGLRKTSYKECHWEQGYNASTQQLEDHALFLQGSGTSVPGSCASPMDFFVRTGGGGDPSLWACNGTAYVQLPPCGSCTGGTTTTVSTSSTTTVSGATTTTTTVTTTSTTTTTLLIACSLLTQGKDVSVSNTYSSASVTPSANALVLASIATKSNSGGATAAPTLSGNGLTWVQTFSVPDAPTGYRVTTYRAMGTSPTAGAITFNFGGGTQRSGFWVVSQCTGVDTTGVNGSAAVRQTGVFGTGTSASGNAASSVAFGAFASANDGTYAAFFPSETAGTPVTPEGGWTELGEQGDTGEAADLEAEWIGTNDSSPTASWTNFVSWGAHAFELVGRTPPACTVLTQGKSITTATSYATASVTPASNALVLAVSMGRAAAGAASASPTVTGNGLTWASVTSGTCCGEAPDTRRLSIARAMGASPTAGAVTFNYGGNSQQAEMWAIVQCTGADTSGTNGSGAIVQTGGSSGTASNAAAFTFGSAPAASSAMFDTFVINDSSGANNLTPDSGMSELAEQFDAGQITDFDVNWILGGDQTIGVTWTGGSLGWAGLGAEIKAAP